MKCSHAYIKGFMQAGAFMAAEAGLDSVPPTWIAKVAKFEEYEELTTKLISQRAIITILPP